MALFLSKEFGDGSPIFNIIIKYYRYYISLLRVTQTANLPCLIVSTFVLIVRKSGYSMSCSDARLTLMQVKMSFKTKPTCRIDQQFKLLKTYRPRAYPHYSNLDGTQHY